MVGRGILINLAGPSADSKEYCDMLMVGLTGGIGSGKSAVARMFKDEGAYVIDLDELARRVVEPDKPAWRDVVAYFGTGILNPDRTVNRSALAEIVFSDPKSRKALEEVTHPRIFEEQDALLKSIKDKGPRSVVVIEIPLLFELSFQKKFDKIILVYVSRDAQIRRSRERDGISEEEVDQRLGAQIPIDEKRVLSDYVIDNEGSLDNTRDQVRAVMRDLRKLAREKEAEVNCS
ncbi:MAG: dephospho-CoA kinase [Deltaproteobacteria bacterium]|nr:dephospho-CoA kinase [Deltaproteobacteria bacterium]